MTLGELIARIEEFPDRFEVRAQHPWTADTEAFVVEAGDGSARELVCRVGDAKEKLRAYLGDPAQMRLARVIAYGESLRADRASADRAARSFSVGGRAPAGYFDDVRRPERAGEYRYTPYRSADHHELATTLGEGRTVRCSMTDGTSFVAVAIPRYGVLEVRDVETTARKPVVEDGPLQMVTLRNPPPVPAKGFQLRDVLALVRLDLPGTRWRVRGVDFVGESEALTQARDRAIVLGGADLFAIVREVQIIDGDFAGERADGTPWVLVRVVEGMDYDVVTKDASFMERLRDRFPHAEDLPADAYSSDDVQSYFSR